MLRRREVTLFGSIELTGPGYAVTRPESIYSPNPTNVLTTNVQRALEPEIIVRKTMPNEELIMACQAEPSLLTVIHINFTY